MSRTETIASLAMALDAYDLANRAVTGSTRDGHVVDGRYGLRVHPPFDVLKASWAAWVGGRDMSACEFCGRATLHVRAVRVTPVRPSVPDVGELVLCGACRDRPGATWRRRWKPVRPPVANAV
jgi:hypothetical protein